VTALWSSPWPAEDGGPTREQVPRGTRGLGIGPGETLALAAHRDAFATTMAVLRDPGEVYLLRHTMGRRALSDLAVAWVERIDPRTLEPIARSPGLTPGPFWPGGLAAHANGSLHVVFGNHCHRLTPDLQVAASCRLPAARPYNSFVVLADGTLAMKDFDHDLRAPATLTLLDPDTLQPCAPDLALPEPAIARLAADGNTIYVVGATTVRRYVWDGADCLEDASWQVMYHGGPRHSYGWDPVIAGGHVWFLDNGAHGYTTTMRGAGQAAGPVRLIRVSVADAGDREVVEVCGRPRGTVTDPPLYDAGRRIAIGYDSGNGVVAAMRLEPGGLRPLWVRELDHAAHMILFPQTGELVLHDFQGPAFARTAVARALAGRWSGPAHRPAVREALARRSGDDVVVLDVETGAERGRARVPSMFQSVLFPCPGFERDLYWCTFSTVARLEVRPAG
jgi:hypothetical protein